MNHKKSLLTAVVLGIFSATSHANECENLNISVYNKTGQVCKLRNSSVMNGKLIAGTIPKELDNGKMSSIFTLQQDYTSGPSIRLEYECEKKSFSLTSQQSLCVGYAGSVTAYYSGSNNANASYSAKEGSWWSSLPGEIVWTLY